MLLCYSAFVSSQLINHPLPASRLMSLLPAYAGKATAYHILGSSMAAFFGCMHATPQVTLPVCRLLTAQLVGQLCGWLVGRLVGWLVGWPVSWVVGWLAG